MGGLFLLSERQMARLSPHVPLTHGVRRMGCRGSTTAASSAIVYIIRDGLQWKDTPKGHGPHKTLIIASSAGAGSVGSTAYSRPFGGRAEAGTPHDRFHASEGAPHRCEPAQKGALSRCIGRCKNGLNPKLHVVCNGIGKPLVMLLTEGRMSDHKGARLMPDALPLASALIAATTPIGSASHRKPKASNRASRRPEAASCHSLMKKASVAPVTRSKTCSPG